MKLITKDTDYAIRALCCIAKKGKKRVNVRELVKDLKIPRPFLRKILQKLNKKKFLKSYKGQSGGFVLCRNPKDICVVDLVKIFQGKIKAIDHIFRKEVCKNMKVCVLRKKLDEIEKYIVSKLESVTIASLMRDVN